MTARLIDRINFRHPRALVLSLTGLMVWWAVAALGVYFLADLPVVGSVLVGWLFTTPYVLGVVALSWLPELVATPGK